MRNLIATRWTHFKFTVTLHVFSLLITFNSDNTPIKWPSHQSLLKNWTFNACTGSGVFLKLHVGNLNCVKIYHIKDKANKHIEQVFQRLFDLFFMVEYHSIEIFMASINF